MNVSDTAPLTATRQGKPRIFISYSRADGEDFATDLRQRLEAENLTLWQDRARMEGGVGWWKQITEALDAVEFMVLVATPAAMASPIVKKEWRYARQQGVCVYPVQVPGLPIDFDAMPRWMRDSHFYNLDHEWETFVSYLKSPCTVQKVPFMAPDLPEHFVQRPEKFESLKRQLLDANFENPVAITTALKGAGGFGKTTLAAALCHDEDVQTAFDEGVLWVTLGENPNIVNALTKLYRALTDENPGFVDIEEGATRLAEKLVDADVLLVIDDVWNPAHLRLFLRGGERVARLVTTRFSNIAVDANADLLEVDEMTTDESVQMLLAGIDPPEDLTPFKALAERLGEWALMLELTNGMLREELLAGSSLDDALTYVNQLLDEEGAIAIEREDGDERRRSAQGVLAASLRQLTDEEARRLCELSIFADDTDVPTTSVKALWGMGSAHVRKLLTRFDRGSLITFDRERTVIRMHDVVREVLASRLDDLPAIHARLIDNYSNLTALPDDYAWHNIAYHLRAAEQLPTLRELLRDFDWLQAKLDATDPNTLLADFDIAASPTDSGDTGQALRLVKSAISMSAHVIGVDKAQLAGQLYGRLVGHKDSQPDITQFLAATNASLQAVLPTLSQAGGALIRTIPLEEHGNALALTEDNAHVVVADRQKVKVFNILTGALLTTFTAHRRGVTALTVADDIALSASDDHTVKVWHWKSGEIVHSFARHTDQVNAVAVTGDIALSASDDHTVKVWHWKSGEILTDFTEHARSIHAVAVEDDIAISGDGNGTIKVWYWKSGEILTDFTAHRSWVHAVAVEDDIAISGDGNGTIKVWHWKSGEILTDFTAHTDSVNAVAIAGNLAFSASRDGTVKVWRWNTGEIINNFTEHTMPVSAVAVAGNLAFSASRDGTVKVWRWNTGETINNFTAHTDKVIALAVDGDIAISVDGDYRDAGTVKVWRWKSGQIINNFTAHTSKVTAVAVAGDIAVSASEDHTVMVWRWNTGEILVNFTAHKHAVTAVAVDGELAFSASRDQTVKVWRWNTGEILTNFTEHKIWVTAVAVTGDITFSASYDRTVKIWRWRTGEILTTFTEHTDTVTTVKVDGDIALSSSEEGTVKVWRWRTGEILTDFTAHTDGVNGVAVAGELAVSASEDQTVKVWRWDTGEILATFTADAPLESLAFDPDQRLLLAGDSAGHVHVLRVVGLDHLLFPGDA